MKTFLIALISGCLVFLAACSKDKDDDKRNVFVGQYTQLTGPAKFVFDAFGQYREEFGRDTASFSIVKVNGADSADYIYLMGGVFADTKAFGSSFHDIALREGGTKIIALFATDTSFTIPYQLPFDAQASSISFDGSGVIRNGQLILTYHTFYRGYNKYSTVTR